MIIYEDPVFTAELLEQGAVLGHIKITPKETVSYLSDLDDETNEHIMVAASKLSSGIFEALGAHGTNIIVNEGEEKFTIDILARTMEDGLDVFWEPKQGDPGELAQTASKVKEKLWYVGKGAMEEDSGPVEEAPAEEAPAESMKMQHLMRSP